MGSKSPNISWLPAVHAKSHSRLLVSQDRHEIYLTFASCDATYINYLKDKKAQPGGYLTMKTYGPWVIDDARSMKHFATIVVAITMLARDAEWE
jgi:hypothetical protein